MKAGRRWRLVFDAGRTGHERSLKVGPGDAGAVAEALVLFRSAMRAAMESDSCRTVTVAIHVDGADCDHEVGPG
jgi:hypothetical protein